MIQAAERIGVSQPYLTQLENGTEPLKSATLHKCLNGYVSFGTLTVERQLELLYEMLQTMESIEIDLTQVTLIRRENLLRLIAALVLNKKHPLGDFGGVSWLVANESIDRLRKAPTTVRDFVIDDFLHTVSRGGTEPDELISVADELHNTISLNEAERGELVSKVREAADTHTQIHDAKRKIAKKLTAMGLTLGQIVEATGLREEQVEEL